MGIGADFRKAAGGCDLAELKRLLPDLPDINEQGPEFRKTALHAAAYKSQGTSGNELKAYQKIMKFLYIHGARNDIKDSTGCIPSDYCPWLAEYIEEQEALKKVAADAIQFSHGKFPDLIERNDPRELYNLGKARRLYRNTAAIALQERLTTATQASGAAIQAIELISFTNILANTTISKVAAGERAMAAYYHLLGLVTPVFNVGTLAFLHASTGETGQLLLINAQKEKADEVTRDTSLIAGDLFERFGDALVCDAYTDGRPNVYYLANLSQDCLLREIVKKIEEVKHKIKIVYLYDNTMINEARGLIPRTSDAATYEPILKALESAGLPTGVAPTPTTRPSLMRR